MKRAFISLREKVEAFLGEGGVGQRGATSTDKGEERAGVGAAAAEAWGGTGTTGRRPGGTTHHLEGPHLGTTDAGPLRLWRALLGLPGHGLSLLVPDPLHGPSPPVHPEVAPGWSEEAT